MQVAPQRVLELVQYLGRLEPGIRPQGILIHEPASGHFPFEAAPYVAAVRAVMDATGWTEPPQQAGGTLSAAGSGLLLVHVTAGYGLAHATVLECLAAGCNGVMASLCEEAEPASVHASSLLDLVNLSRLGNPHVAAHFNMDQLRAAAQEVSAMVLRAQREADKTAEREAAQQAQQQQQQQQAKPPTASTSPSHSRQPLILGHA
ncbi:hypothetical protein Vretimale_11841 [Volvox reticuliferus]|nr:hypothetical protein Vretifemale_11386 [Volvox reticuliferus]GIM07769.1 hypothetical protein Vretimale_11841 [Volvox reticuliferus]